LNLLKAELERIKKNNKTLQLIQLQYEKEIDRRRTAMNAETVDCKHSSPKK